MYIQDFLFYYIIRAFSISAFVDWLLFQSATYFYVMCIRVQHVQNLYCQRHFIQHSRVGITCRCAVSKRVGIIINSPYCTELYMFTSDYLFRGEVSFDPELDAGATFESCLDDADRYDDPGGILPPCWIALSNRP